MDSLVSNVLDPNSIAKEIDNQVQEKVCETNEPCNKKIKLNENENERKLDKDKTDVKSLESKESEPIEKNKEKAKSEGAQKNDSDDEDLSTEHEIPEPGFNYPLEQDASDMLDDVDFDENKDYFPSVTERYFTPYYAIDVGKPCEDVCIRIHSNRVCMVSLAPSHVIFQQNKTITNCNFQVTPKVDRLKNKFSGKGKRGAQCLQKTSPLCHLTCSDGSVYTIKCCMNGKLIEVNERLLKEPELLKKEPHFGGYIAIVLPNLIYHDEKLKNELLNQQKYDEAIKKRHAEMEKIDKNSTEISTLTSKKEEISKEEPTKEVVNMEVVEEKQNEKLNSMEIVDS